MRSLIVAFLVLISLVTSPVTAEVLALTGGTLVDVAAFGRSSRDVRDAVVVVRDGRIVAAGPRAKVRIPADARRVDVSGKWLVPGYIDGFSAQLDTGQAYANLAMGVTTISQTNRTDPRRGVYVAASPQPNARLLGGIYGYDWTGLENVTGFADIRARGRRMSDAEIAADMDKQAAEGAAGFMFMYALDDAQVAAAARHARERGWFTIGELGYASYVRAAAAGVRTMIHTSRVEAELAPPDLRSAIAATPFGPPNSPLSIRYGEFLGSIDPDSPAFKAYAGALARHGAAIMPTLAIATTTLPDTPNPWDSPAGPLIDITNIRHLPFDRATGRAAIPDGAPADYREARAARSSKSLEVMRGFHRAAVRFLTGSGAVAFGVLPGWGLHRELELLTRSGLTPREALAAATDNYAALYGWRDVGRIAPGYIADIVVLDADPTADIANAARIATVYKGGVDVDRSTLLRWRPAAR